MEAHNIPSFLLIEFNFFKIVYLPCVSMTHSMIEFGQNCLRLLKNMLLNGLLVKEFIFLSYSTLCLFFWKLILRYFQQNASPQIINVIIKIC